MTSRIILVAYILAVGVFRCPSFSMAQKYNLVATTPSDVFAKNQSVTFQCDFVNLWNGQDHPNEYPRRNAHWSPPVIVSHNSSTYTMWEAGSLASPGVEVVAETGGTRRLINEISRAGSAALTPVVGTSQFNINQQQQTISNIAADGSHYSMSSITMIAPSPDWFSGFYNFDVRDASNNRTTYYQSFSIETFPWDAGTEAGDTYSVNNPAQNPVENIQQLTNETIPSTTNVFLNPETDTVLPVARWDCRLE